jgi:hypothetical protein
MTERDMMPIEVEPEQLWTLQPDRKYVRLQLPPLRVQGINKPLNVHVDFDAGIIDQIIDRLMVLRPQMLPKPSKPGRQN